jgi:type II secretory pathway predicted ATPase ExeA
VYLAFYGLREKPFGVTPDPHFLYLAPSHREALAELTYGVQEKKGFLLLTGEVGTGKTTLLHALLRRLDAQTAAAFVFNSTLPFDALLEYALEDFGVSKAGESYAQRLMALNTFLIERRRAGQNTVLIIDEAQNLSPESLEQVRLLSNFETSTEKLLQILLVGQPELEQRLALPALRQLKQRIALRCRIQPLSVEETVDYVRARLRTAGARDIGLFTAEALARVATHAGGVPRVINALCDHALLIGYADQERRIDRRIVDEAMRYLEMGEAAEGRDPGAGARPGVRLGRWREKLPRWAVVGGTVIAGGAIAAATALTLRADALHGVVNPLADLATLLRDVAGR